MYSTQLIDRVRDPINVKKTAIQSRIARIKSELEEYNETSDAIRQEWAISSNEVLRMAGNALREIVVCAEEDMLMLEDEVGRLDGILEPKDQDGPKGRVTSGQYHNEFGSSSFRDDQPTLPTNRRVPSVPRSPVFPCEPQSASKLGVEFEDSNSDDDSTGGGPSPVVPEFVLSDRMNNFLLDDSAAPVHSQPLHSADQSHHVAAAIDMPSDTAPAAQPVDTEDKNQYITVAIDHAMKRQNRTIRKVESQNTMYNMPVPSVTVAAPSPTRHLRFNLGDIKENSTDSELSSHPMTRAKPGPIKQHLDQAWGVADPSSQSTETSESASSFQSTMLDDVFPIGSGMGLVEWQRLRDAGDTSAARSISEVDIEAKYNPSEDSFDRNANVNISQLIDAANSIATDPSARNRPAPIKNQQADSLEPMYRRPNREGAVRHNPPAKVKALKGAARDAVMDEAVSMVDDRFPESSTHTIGNLHGTGYGLTGIPRNPVGLGINIDYGGEGYGYHDPQSAARYSSLGYVPGMDRDYTSALNLQPPIARMSSAKISSVAAGVQGLSNIDKEKRTKEFKDAVWAKAIEDKARAAGGDGQAKEDGNVDVQAARGSASATTGGDAKQPWKNVSAYRPVYDSPAHLNMEDPFI